MKVRWLPTIQIMFWIPVLTIFPLCTWSQTPVASVSEIVGRMQAAKASYRGRGISYTVIRQYALSNNNPRTPNHEITAKVNVAPPTGLNYALSTSLRDDFAANIVRRVLDHEAQLASHSERGALSADNYNFTLLGDAVLDGHRCYVLQLTPKREAAELLRGRAWVDADSFMVRRIKGQPAKSPSWWIKDLRVTLEFGEIAGLWIQIATNATAEVRWMGTQTLTSTATDVRTGTLNASNFTPFNPSPEHTATHILALPQALSSSH